ncbi:MAG: hypothetical protein J7604_03515 [Sporocytophaga sp.]|uniref:hypothetical protein n=1 Tax=Sporocytophaga sp. TaxID=2231183 RepID=UPI001AFE4104|nr:hypothetical protein [Sporocytophaga sp.]MBO9699249.1 hypothetical protein [Sporocytophaga sp.]
MNKLKINNKESDFIQVDDKDATFGYSMRPDNSYLIYGQDQGGNVSIEIHDDLNNGIAAMKGNFKAKQEQLTKSISDALRAEAERQERSKESYAMKTFREQLKKSIEDQNEKAYLQK